MEGTESSSVSSTDFTLQCPSVWQRNLEPRTWKKDDDLSKVRQLIWSSAEMGTQIFQSLSLNTSLLRLHIYRYGSHSPSPATCPHPPPPTPHPSPSTSHDLLLPRLTLTPTTWRPYAVEAVFESDLNSGTDSCCFLAMYTCYLKYFEPQFLHLYNGKNNILLIRLWWSCLRLCVSEADFGARQVDNYCVLCLSVHSPPLSLTHWE